MADNPIDALVPTAQNSADSRPHGNRAMTAPGKGAGAPRLSNPLAPGRASSRDRRPR